MGADTRTACTVCMEWFRGGSAADDLQDHLRSEHNIDRVELDRDAFHHARAMEGWTWHRWLSRARDMGWSVRDIADELDLSTTTVFYAAKKHGVDLTDDQYPEGASYRDEDWLVEKHHGDGLTISAMAEDQGVSHHTISYWMDKRGVEKRTPDWTGDGTTEQNLWSKVGRRVKRRDGGECVECGSDENLHVHHIVPVYEGGDRFDPENLETLCASCHYSRHYE